MNDSYQSLVALLAHPCAGPLALPVVRLLCLMRNDDDDDRIVSLHTAGPGFTLPADIGDWDTAITRMDLSSCFLIGFEVEVAFFLLGIDIVICCCWIFCRRDSRESRPAHQSHSAVSGGKSAEW